MGHPVQVPGIKPFISPSPSLFHAPSTLETALLVLSAVSQETKVGRKEGSEIGLLGGQRTKVAAGEMSYRSSFAKLVGKGTTPWSTVTQQDTYTLASALLSI